MTKVIAVVGLQFGSEAKGNIVGRLALDLGPDTLVHNWSPNAGHTLITGAGRKFVHSMVPLGIVSPNLKRILIGPGAVIDPRKLSAELASISDILSEKNVEIIIHPAAAVVTDDCFETEKAFVRIGSTMKGSAAAAINRMNRDPENAAIAGNKLHVDHLPYSRVEISKLAYDNAITTSELILAEGCQGFGLSMYHGFYPYCTSRDTSVHQLLADCAIPRHFDVEVYGVMRTYPIRVANRYDDKGEMVGWSGPGYYDQEETSWAELGLEPEYTTVTKLERRVFTFSHTQIAEACRINGVDKLALTFCDYIDDAQVAELCKSVEEINGVPVAFLGFGPNVNQVLPVEDSAYHVESIIKKRQAS
ncbi:succino-amino-deoxyadenylate synthase PurZ [Zhongshania sp.]|uniref:succino-amino-deoxyadenylate synthase PurZ n=1 Tax=Zhongshania sp. TaxID=1971902 RepID=UPI003563703D